jgi:hypothetical protein
MRLKRAVSIPGTPLKGRKAILINMYQKVLLTNFVDKEFTAGEFLTQFIKMYPHSQSRPSERQLTGFLRCNGLTVTVSKRDSNHRTPTKYRMKV